MRQASAPCFPYGVIDPIAEIAGRMATREVGVHVDAALGGLFLPFLDAAGAEVPDEVFSAAAEDGGDRDPPGDAEIRADTGGATQGWDK